MIEVLFMFLEFELKTDLVLYIDWPSNLRISR